MDTPQVVCALVWAEFLGIVPPQPEDNFFLLGGDSLSALAVVKRLVEWDGELSLSARLSCLPCLSCLSGCQSVCLSVSCVCPSVCPSQVG